MNRLRAAPRSRAAAFLFLVLLAFASLSPLARAASAVDVSPPAAASVGASEPQRIPSDIPLRRETTSDVANPSSTVWPTLIVLLGLAGLFIWTVRRKRLSGSAAPSAGGASHGHRMWPAPLGRWLSSNGAAPVQVLSNQRLTPRHSIHLVQWQGRTYLLGCGEQHITVIDSAPVDEDTAPPADGSKP